MITSFAVQADLTAIDNVSPVLMRMAEKFSAIDKLIGRLEERFRTFGASFEASVGSKAESMANSVTMAMGQIDTAVIATTANIRKMADEMKDVAGAAWAAPASASRAASGAVGRGSTGGVGRSGLGPGRGGMGAMADEDKYEPWDNWRDRRPSFPLPYQSSNIAAREQQKRAEEQFQRAQREASAAAERARQADHDLWVASQPAWFRGEAPAAGEEIGVGTRWRSQEWGTPATFAVGGGRDGASSNLRARGLGGGHSGGGGIHVSPQGARPYGALPISPFAVGGFGLFEGIKEATALEHTAARVFSDMGIAGTLTGPLRDDPRFKEIKETIIKAYIQSGASLEDIEAAYLSGARLLSPLLPEERFQAVNAVLPMATAEWYSKPGTNVDEAMKAYVGQAHMAQRYGVANISEMAEHLQYLSTTTDASVQATMRSASYVMPLTQLGGYDPLETLSMITGFQRAGIINTKSGTWLRNMMERATEDPSLMSEKKYAEWERDMVNLHLMSPTSHQLTFLDEKGLPSSTLLGIRMHEAEEAMGPGKFKAYLEERYGMQGKEGAAMVSSGIFLDQIRLAKEGEKNFLTGEKMWKFANEQDPSTIFHSSWARFNAELLNTGELVLPYVTKALKWANEKMGGRGEIDAVGGGLLAWMTKGLWGPAVGRAAGFVAGALGVEGLSILAAGAGGAYEATRLTSPSGAREVMATPDPGQAERERIMNALNPGFNERRNERRTMVDRGTPSQATIVAPLAPPHPFPISSGAAPVNLIRPAFERGSIGPSGLGPGHGGMGGGMAVSAAAPAPNVHVTVSAPQVHVHNYLDSSEIAAQTAVHVIPAIVSHVLGAIGGALHLGNQHQQGPAGGAMDAPAGNGVGVN